MALSLYVDNLDGLDEGVKDLYKEHGAGGYMLDVDGVEDVKGLKSAIAQERELRRDAEARAKRALTKEELLEFEELRAQAAKSAGADKLLEQIKARHERELEIKTLEAQKLRQTLERTAIESKASQVLAKHGADVGLLMPHIFGQLKAEEIDGKFDVVPTEATSIDDVIKALRTNYPAAFADLRGSGGGARGGAGGNNGPDLKKLSPIERLNAARQIGK